MTRRTHLWVISNSCMAGRPIKDALVRCQYRLGLCPKMKYHPLRGWIFIIKRSPCSVRFLIYVLPAIREHHAREIRRRGERGRPRTDGRTRNALSSAFRAHMMPMNDRAARPCRRCAAAHSAAELCRRTVLDSSSCLCLAAVRKNRKNFYFPIDKPFEKVYYCVSRLIH